MTEACERCGEPLPASARFCPNCGFAVGTPPADERKTVTIVFADLVGSTQLSAQIDPERYREVIAGFYRAVSEELTSLRGRAFNFAGDAVVGVFGIPQVHDDDALRAVRAGLALVDRIGRVGEELSLPLPLRIRVGINTGPVAIGSESSEQGLLFGATVNLAARLEQAADPGTVLVAERTWMLTRAQVEYDEPHDVTAKGFDDVARAWPVRALAPGSSRRTIPFVDRKRELRLLTDAFDGAVETRRGHLVSLLGEPGIGKSRVAEEFLAGLPEGTKVLVGRANRYEEDAAFAPLAQMVLQLLGDRANAPEDRLLAHLQELAAACCPPEESDQVAARVALALGIADEDPRHDEGRYRVAEVRSGLLRLLDGLSRAAPVVLVFEDAHLAQASMLDLIEQIVRNAKPIPLLVLCVARNDLLEERPGWGGGLGDSLNLYLEPMSQEDGTQLALEAGEGIDVATAELVARHAGGNPFFIVETIGMLRHEAGEVPPDGDVLPERLLPPTVQAVVASRIDHLPVAARELVRKASVFARSTFDVAELKLIAEPDPALLELLEDEQILARDEERADVWRFRHGIVRDVAYESLPKRERQRLHLHVATELAGDPSAAARYPRTIAYHLERAARAALDLVPGDRDLAVRARDALAHAGDLALEASDGPAASDLYGRAIAMAGAESGWGPAEAAILANLGEARYWQGEFDAATPALRRALELDGSNARIRAQASRYLGDIELSVRGNRERAGELFEQALSAARELGDPWTLARTLLVAGWEPYWRDDFATARVMFDEALQVARSNPSGDPWAETRALVTLATIVAEDGDEEEVLALASQALAIAEASGDRFSIAVARENVGGSLRRLDRMDEAVQHLDAAVDAYRLLGARWEVASALTSRGVAHRLAGRGTEALRDLREAYRLCRDLKERSIVGWTAGNLARALADAGEFGAARGVIAEVSQFAEALGQVQVDWLVESEAEILLAEGDLEGARAKASEMLEIRRQRGSPRDVAAAVWWTGRVFGADAVGGDEEIEQARKFLEATHSQTALRRPDLTLQTELG